MSKATIGGRPTNVEASAVNTLGWLSSSDMTLAVPVFQRRYRWDLDDCSRLIADILAASDVGGQETHFIGSILASESSDGGITELVLIDGQQRLVTVSLLVAALHQAMASSDAALARELSTVLEHPVRTDRPRLRPHSDRGRVFDNIVIERPAVVAEADGSRFARNYAYFLAQVADDGARIWEGLQRLEHVVVTLKELANPQQIFESLNSTGAPLQDHELIHNYVLMRLTHDQQTEIEDEYWIPIEDNTAGAVENFLRDYLVLKTWRDDHFSDQHGVYDVFKNQFPTLRFTSLRKRHAPEWREYSEIYRVLLKPALAHDDDITRQLTDVNTFGRATYPLLLDLYRDHWPEREAGGLSRDLLLEILGLLQSLFIRRTVVGQSRSGIIARLCRTWSRSGDPTELIGDIARRMPSDQRIRTALRLGRLPHAGFVLGRIGEVDVLDGLEIEHIFPQGPSSSWSGGEGAAPWGTFDDDAQARHRELLNTIGNLTLLEQPLNAAAGNKPFHDKREYYQLSRVAETKKLADLDSWGIDAIEQRTAALTEAFLRTWSRPEIREFGGDDRLRLLLDVPQKPGFYEGWKTEFDYVKYHGEIWEVRNVRELAERVFKHLWSTRREEVLAWNADNAGPISTDRPRQSEALDGSHYLNTAWRPQWHLWASKNVLDELDLVDDVYVKYSSDGPQADDEAYPDTE